MSITWTLAFNVLVGSSTANLYFTGSPIFVPSEITRSPKRLSWFRVRRAFSPAGSNSAFFTYGMLSITIPSRNNYVTDYTSINPPILTYCSSLVQSGTNQPNSWVQIYPGSDFPDYINVYWNAIGIPQTFTGTTAFVIELEFLEEGTTPTFSS